MPISALPGFIDAASDQFSTSSQFPVPEGREPWKIRNDYPTATGPLDAPWLDIDPTGDPREYMAVVKKYCLEGMVENNFIPQNNKVRDWYHAPWMHWGPDGREPLQGLIFERPAPPKETSATQLGITQTWVIDFYGHEAATVLGNMWANPAKPKWDDHIRFPRGSIISKLVFTTASDVDLPSMVGSPTWEAAIAHQPTLNQAPAPYARTIVPSKVRLLQMDFATKDPHSVVGWIYGGFMYNGLTGQTGWDGLMDIGLSWGNDPDLTQAAFKAGQTVHESWVSPELKDLFNNLKGGRPSLGWNGRANGPADLFTCSCLSCHQTCQWPPIMEPMVPPNPIRNDLSQLVPQNDKNTMRWFRNIPSGETWDGKGLTGDTSLLLQIGYKNFQAWKLAQEGSELPDHFRIRSRNSHAIFPYIIA